MRAPSPIGIVAALAGVLVAVAFATAVHGANEPQSTARRDMSTSRPWDLVYISDSSGWGVAPLYARHIRQDRRVTVRVHDEWQSGLPAVTILERLRTPGDTWIRLVRNAEVIVVYGNPTGLGIKTVERGDCFCLAATGCRAPIALGPQTWRAYVATLKAIYKRIFELRTGKPVILRTADWYEPVISHAPDSPFWAHTSWEEAGIVDPCTRWHESWSAAIARAADAYGVPVADVYGAFNGPGHREDPFAKGYLQDDGIHPSNPGRTVIAEALAALGYRQVKPPR
jgi:hypothetical protein